MRKLWLSREELEEELEIKRKLERKGLRKILNLRSGHVELKEQCPGWTCLCKS